MKIILSGGWGYGNIGDDLILSSTISMLQKKYPNASFVVLTYSISDSQSHRSDNVSLAYGLHRKIDCNNSKYKYSKLYDDVTILTKIKRVISQRISDSKLYSKAMLYLSQNQITTVFKDADLYVMCGGGYFNERWISKVEAQLAELQIAQSMGIKTAIIGPTIGNIPKRLVESASETFKNVNLITVRDEASKNTLSNLNAEAKIISDIALSDWEIETNNISKINKVGIVFTTGAGKMMDNIVSDLVEFHDKSDNTVEYKFIITRTWKRDLQATKSMMSALLERGISSKVVIPSDHVSLELEMTKCDLVISENLHGLISATRNLVPVIAINDYPKESPNGKKFLGFLKQFEIDDFYIDSKSETQKLYRLINEIESNYPSFRENIDSKRNKIKAIYNSELEVL